MSDYPLGVGSQRRSKSRKPIQWRYGLVAAAAVLVGGLAVNALSVPKPPPADDIGTASQTTDVEPSATPSQDPNDPTVVFIEGDSYVAGSPENGEDPTFSEIFAEKWMVESDGIGRTGYINKGKNGAPNINTRMVEAMDPYKVDLVILAGGTNDIYYPTDEVVAAATKAIKIVRKHTPSSDIVMLSPFQFHDPEGADILRVDDALKFVAKKYDVPYINVRDVFEDKPLMVGKDGVHPDGEGHAFLAEYLEKELADLGLPRRYAYKDS